jgi:hypothetical protein
VRCWPPRPPAQHQPEDLGHHPGADGEISAAQAKHDERGRERENTRDQPRKHDGDERIEAHEHREREQEVTAKPDERLLAHGHQPRITRKQVPQLRQRQHVEDEDQVLHEPAARKQRQEYEHGHERRARERDVARDVGRDLDPVVAAHGRLNRPRAGTGPRGRNTSTTRNGARPGSAIH